MNSIPEGIHIFTRNSKLFSKWKKAAAEKQIWFLEETKFGRHRLTTRLDDAFRIMGRDIDESKIQVPLAGYAIYEHEKSSRTLKAKLLACYRRFKMIFNP
jgi:hypothetical protein